MLILLHAMAELRFSELMAVYFESNQWNGRDKYSNLTEFEQLHMAEQDFYNYLNSVFFCQSNSFYAVWVEQGQYCSTLRIEPYQDGYLLCALETKPSERKCGYAGKLIHNVQKYMSEQGNGIIYSHVGKKNTASLAVHKACGFEVIKDYSVYSDGSVLRNSYTLSYTYEKSEIQ